MWLETSFARTQVYMFLWYWWCDNPLEALESSWWIFVKRSLWSALKVERDIMICNSIIIYLIEKYNFFHREMFGEADLVDIFPPQIRYGPINFLIAGSKKFFDQLSELPGYQQNRTWPIYPLKQKLDKWAFITQKSSILRSKSLSGSRALWYALQTFSCMQGDKEKLRNLPAGSFMLCQFLFAFLYFHLLRVFYCKTFGCFVFTYFCVSFNRYMLYILCALRSFRSIKSLHFTLHWLRTRGRINL